MLRVFGHRKSLWLWRVTDNHGNQQVYFCSERPANPEEVKHPKLRKKWFNSISHEDLLKKKQFKALSMIKFTLFNTKVLNLYIYFKYFNSGSFFPVRKFQT